MFDLVWLIWIPLTYYLRYKESCPAYWPQPLRVPFVLAASLPPFSVALLFLACVLPVVKCKKSFFETVNLCN
jgi:hypothetical protein